jgi:hypothetical protein
MPTYLINGTITISCYTRVVAKNDEEAKKIAAARGNCSLMDCERMGDSEDDVWCHSGEMDGTPEITDIEKE